MAEPITGQPITPPGERFPQWIRIRQRADFQYVLEGGRRASRPRLVLTARPRRTSDGSGAPLAAPKLQGSEGGSSLITHNSSLSSPGSLASAPPPSAPPPLPTRLGLTVSRRVGNAVVRNRVKRRLRESFRRLHAALVPGYDLVVGARPTAAGATFAQLDRDLRECLQSLKLLPPSSLPDRASSGESSSDSSAATS